MFFKFLLAAASFSSTAFGGERATVLIELFTSQGCSSCPPADRVLSELAARPDVLPLSFHVTYWDRLGWSDTFGLDASTHRQEAYADWLGLEGLYTPQMVIGGRIDVVGSQRERVRAAIDLLLEHGEPGPDVTFGQGRVRLAAGEGGPAIVWLAAFDEMHEVAIGRGENRGRSLTYRNVVREIAEIGRWTGASAELALPIDRLKGEGRDALAILVQRAQDGAILAAGRLDLP
jgi:hypothetical protein